MLLFLTGVLTWPLLEYVLHRFLGHDYSFLKPFKVEHQTHHQKKDYFASPLKKFFSAAFVLCLMTGANSLWLSWSHALIFSFGFVSMYLFYEFTHFSLHKFAPRTRFGLILRKHHFSHHFTNATYNHGVTNTFADHLFGTYRLTDCVSVPKTFAPDWLCDATGVVMPQYQKHFQLRQRVPWMST